MSAAAPVRDEAVAAPRVRTVLVTGGVRGLGREIVRALAYDGHRVVAGYRTDDNAAADLAAEQHRLGRPVHCVRVDITDPKSVHALAGELQRRFGHIDGLVNNAAVDGHRPADRIDSDEWERVVGTDLGGAVTVLYGTAHLLAPGASVVSIGAAAAARGVPGRVHYGAAKAGLTGMTRSLGKELGRAGVRFNVVAPGPILDDADEHSDPQRAAALREHVAPRTALGRVARPADVVAAVLFLLGEDASYVTGTTLTVDGGM